jgi:hypothetical protein
VDGRLYPKTDTVRCRKMGKNDDFVLRGVIENVECDLMFDTGTNFSGTISEGFVRKLDQITLKRKIMTIEMGSGSETIQSENSVVIPQLRIKSGVRLGGKELILRNVELQVIPGEKEEIYLGIPWIRKVGFDTIDERIQKEVLEEDKNPYFKSEVLTREGKTIEEVVKGLAVTSRGVAIVGQVAYDANDHCKWIISPEEGRNLITLNAINTNEDFHTGSSTKKRISDVTAEILNLPTPYVEVVGTVTVPVWTVDRDSVVSHISSCVVEVIKNVESSARLLIIGKMISRELIRTIQHLYNNYRK